MRKLLLLLAVALAFSLPGFAQAAGGQSDTSATTSSTTKKSKTKATAGAKESQLTGCLAKNAAGSGFMLTNGRYKKGVEVKSSEDLTAHVGHQVQLMGTWEKPAAGAESATMRTFSATSMKHISDTCPAAAGKKGGKKAAGEKPTGL